jgi:alpha-pyrone synthase
MHKVYLNRIGTAVPENDVHASFVAYAPKLLSDETDRKKFRVLARRAGIEHRHSVLRASQSDNKLDADNFYQPGAFPSTRARMALYKEHAFPLAQSAIETLGIVDERDRITHVIVTSCTGFYAPGLDHDIIRHYGLNPTVERTIVGFMGCQAAMNAMKLAYHAVRSDPAARVLMVNLELCTLHLQELDDIDQIMSFLIFADGCAASLISAEPVGFEILGFHADILPESREHITWHIGDTGFDMVLAREVPVTISTGIAEYVRSVPGILNNESIRHWAVHPGGRAILDAVRHGLGLSEEALATSSEILRTHGNMSSATVMFVLQAMLSEDMDNSLGMAIAFGPGLSAEGMLFRAAQQ